MSAANANGDTTNTSQSEQDTQSSQEQGKPTSHKLQQVVIFLKNTEEVIEQYLNKKNISNDDNEILQSTVKNLAVVLKSGDEDQIGYLLELMENSDDKMMQLLSKLVFQLFKGRVLAIFKLISPENMLIFVLRLVSLLK